jgi:hypothetical protein
MVKPARIEGTTYPVGQPENWTEATHGPCQALHVREDDEGGLRVMRSAWEVESDEAGWLLAGANLQIGISAPRHPVVMMGLGPTPLEGQPVYTIRLITSLRGEPGVHVAMYAPKAGLATKTGGKVWAEAAIVGGDLGEAVKEALAEIAAVAMKENIA